KSVALPAELRRPDLLRRSEIYFVSAFFESECKCIIPFKKYKDIT
ncbi:MAG: hypothetical protein ACI83W_000497, partial [Marinoscillum sp.]